MNLSDHFDSLKRTDSKEQSAHKSIYSTQDQLLIDEISEKLNIPYSFLKYP